MIRKILRFIIILIILAAVSTGFGLYVGLVELPKQLVENPYYIKAVEIQKKLFPPKPKVTKRVATKEDASARRIKQLENQVSVYRNRVNDLEMENKQLNSDLDKANELLKTQMDTIDKTKGSKQGYGTMAKYYMAMDRKKAAEILMKLDDETVIGILQGMQPDTASGILSAMEPQRAAVITQKMIQ